MAYPNLALTGKAFTDTARLIVNGGLIAKPEKAVRKTTVRFIPQRRKALTNL